MNYYVPASAYDNGAINPYTAERSVCLYYGEFFAAHVREFLSRKPASRVIYQGAHYTACAMKDGSLVITKRKGKGGVQLTGATASHWIAEIEMAIDTHEAHELCRAVINSAH